MNHYPKKIFPYHLLRYMYGTFYLQKIFINIRNIHCMPQSEIIKWKTIEIIMRHNTSDCKVLILVFIIKFLHYYLHYSGSLQYLSLWLQIDCDTNFSCCPLSYKSFLNEGKSLIFKNSESLAVFKTSELFVLYVPRIK